MLSRALDTHALTQKGKDGEWVHILLDFLKSYVEHRGADMLIPIDDPEAYVSKFVVALKDVASGIDSGESLLTKFALTNRTESRLQIFGILIIQHSRYTQKTRRDLLATEMGRIWMSSSEITFRV